MGGDTLVKVLWDGRNLVQVWEPGYIYIKVNINCCSCYVCVVEHFVLKRVAT